MGPLTVDQLFAIALSGEYEESDEAGRAVSERHKLATRAVLERASQLSESPDPRERAGGADAPGQLGFPQRAFPEQCFAVISRMLKTESETRPRR